MINYLMIKIKNPMKNNLKINILKINILKIYNLKINLNEIFNALNNKSFLFFLSLIIKGFIIN